MQSCWNFWASWGMNSQYFNDVTSLDRLQLISFKLFSAEKQTSKWEEQELTDHFFSCFEVFNWNFNFEKHLIEKNASISKIWSVRQERIKPLRDWKDYFKAWAAFINPLKIQLRRRRLYWEKKIRECDSAWMVLWKKYQVYLLHLCSCVSCDHWDRSNHFFYYNPTSTGALLRRNTPDEKSRYQFPFKL